MLYAEVSVNSPAAQSRLFSYSIPPDLHVQAGQAVWVPFGQKTLQGVVFGIGTVPAFEQTRDITGVIGEKPVLSPWQLELARWLSDYYLCPLFEAVALMLPPGFLRKTLTFIEPSGRLFEASSLSPCQAQVMKLLEKEGRLEMGVLEKSLGKKAAQAAVSGLVGCGLISRKYEAGPVRVKAKEEQFIRLAADKSRVEAVIQNKKSPRQAALLRFLLNLPGEISAAEARKATGCNAGIIRALAKKGFIQSRMMPVSRQVISYQDIIPSKPPELNCDQQTALEKIKKSLADKKPAVFLLHGVTGSGKTEIYLGALAEAIRLGRKGIVLVPEISLTPQTIGRFAARFPHRVAVMHSRLSPGEQYDQWQGIEQGNYDVVIGARGAIFCPMPDVSLIVIDEEHEWSYKQDSSPRYHARNVALKLAELTGAVVILGSATPDVETFYRAGQGEFNLLTLPKRIAGNGGVLPQVSTIDLKEELKSGNTGIFSRHLKEAINQTLCRGEQAILFFNRRGAATFVQCRACGRVLRCRRCDIPLNYHSGRNVLLCHRCGYNVNMPPSCPQCSGKFRFMGMGTEKVEQEAAAAFPGARILRWDSDAIREKDSHREIMEKLASHRVDILIGTQMIAKGLDLPLVTLVGVINADTGLSLPDFRAGERTFQLLCQVAGRAGRSELGGRVIIQSYYPENYAVRAALEHDYASFYKKEIAFRRELGYPPFSQLARLVYHHPDNAACRRGAEKMKQELLTEADRYGITGLTVTGPSPAFIHRLRGSYRWQLILRGSDLSAFLRPISFNRGWTIDIDPLGA